MLGAWDWSYGVSFTGFLGTLAASNVAPKGVARSPVFPGVKASLLLAAKGGGMRLGSEDILDCNVSVVGNFYCNLVGSSFLNIGVSGYWMVSYVPTYSMQ